MAREKNKATRTCKPQIQTFSVPLFMRRSFGRGTSHSVVRLSFGEEKMELLGERVKAVLQEAAEEVIIKITTTLLPMAASPNPPSPKGRRRICKPSKVQAMRSKVDSWPSRRGFPTHRVLMDRSQDGLDGMVVIFQTVLQAYSGSVIERVGTTSSKPLPRPWQGGDGGGEGENGENRCSEMGMSRL